MVGGGLPVDSSSRASRVAVGSMEERAPFSENRHWHRSRNKFREELSREQRGKRPRPDQVFSVGSFDRHTSNEYEKEGIVSSRDTDTTALLYPRETDAVSSKYGTIKRTKFEKWSDRNRTILKNDSHGTTNCSGVQETILDGGRQTDGTTRCVYQ
ncbi:hypothetical protein J6590_048763 [Homalodisca vitripennis]|nr:hypothetical protein J6590_048763 [Homalodisca vitripennis]